MTHLGLALEAELRAARPGEGGRVPSKDLSSCPSTAGAREFFGDFAGRHQSRFQRAALEGAPDDPELAAAYLFGQRLLETWQRGLVWRSPEDAD